MQPQTVLEQFVKDFQQGLQQAAFNEAAKLGKGHCKNFEEYKKHKTIHNSPRNVLDPNVPSTSTAWQVLKLIMHLDFGYKSLLL